MSSIKPPKHLSHLCSEFNIFSSDIDNTLENLINSKLTPISNLEGFFFFYRGFLSRPFTNHSTAGEGRRHFLTPHYHLHPLHRHLDISRLITAESSPLHICSSRTRTRNLWFPSASRQPLSYLLKKMA